MYNLKHMQFGPLNIDGNIYVFAVIGIFFLLAFIFGEGRLKRIATALLAGFFVADQLGGFLARQLDSSINGPIDAAFVQLVVLLVVTVGLSLGKTPSVGGRFGLRSFVLAFLTAATLIGYTQSYLAHDISTKVLEEYNLIALAAENRLWLLTAMTGWLILITVWKRKTKEDDDKKGKKGKKKK